MSRTKTGIILALALTVAGAAPALAAQKDTSNREHLDMGHPLQTSAQSGARVAALAPAAQGYVNREHLDMGHPLQAFTRSAVRVTAAAPRPAYGIGREYNNLGADPNAGIRSRSFWDAGPLERSVW